MDHKTELFGVKRKQFHVRSESCVYGQDTSQEVLAILTKACERGFEPIGIILTPSAKGGGYAVTVYTKIACPRANAPEKPCPYCVTEAAASGSK